MLLSKERTNQLVKAIGKAMYQVKRMENKNDERMEKAKTTIATLISEAISFCKQDRGFNPEKFMEDCRMFSIAYNEIMM